MNERVSGLISHFRELIKYTDKSDGFKRGTWANAIRWIESFNHDEVDFEHKFRELKISGIGPATLNECDAYFKCGTSNRLNDLKAAHQEDDDLDLASFDGSGLDEMEIMTIYAIHDIGTLSKLVEACQQGLINEDEIYEKLIASGKARRYYNRTSIIEYAEKLKDDLDVCCAHVDYAGSLRRERPRIKDFDFVVASSDPNHVKKCLIDDGYTVTGEVKLNVEIMTPLGQIHADIRIIQNPDEYTAALVQWTGPMDLNVRMRSSAKSKGMKLNDKGIELEDGTMFYPKTEEELFEKLGWKYLEPKERV